MTAETEQPPSERLAALREALAIAIVLGELVWLIDTRMGTRESRWLGPVARKARDAGRHWWARVTAPSRARAEAPAVVWEAWMAMLGEDA